MRKGKIQLEEPPKGLIEIHENEDPVRIKIDRKFYAKLEKAAEELGTTPDVLINNALLLILKRAKRKGERKK
jgi:hypothetical protein